MALEATGVAEAPSGYANRPKRVEPIRWPAAHDAEAIRACSPEEHTRTPEKSCFYVARCEVDGVEYTARSRYGAAYELARVLVAAGVADRPMRVTYGALKGVLVFASIAEAAKWTIEETATKPAHLVRWEDPVLKRARIAAAFREKQAETDFDGGGEGSDLSVDKSPDAIASNSRAMLPSCGWRPIVAGMREASIL